MRVRHLVSVAALLLVVAATWTTAPAVAVNRVALKVLAGENVGFRVEGLRGGVTPVGRVVVKVNGEWVEAELAGSSAAPLSTR